MKKVKGSEYFLNALYTHVQSGGREGEDKQEEHTEGSKVIGYVLNVTACVSICMPVHAYFYEQPMLKQKVFDCPVRKEVKHPVCVLSVMKVIHLQVFPSHSERCDLGSGSYSTVLL